MSKYQTTISADGTVELGVIKRNTGNFPSELMFFGYGTWGSGTLTLYWSPDAGTTKIAMTDLSNAAVTSTVNFGIRSSFITGGKNSDKIHLYATLAGSTNPSLTVGFYDND